MAYETGTATDLEDLVGKLSTFLTGSTAAWTEDEYDTGNDWATFHKNNVYVSFRWESTNTSNLGIYQSLGWTDTNAPHDQDDDSGNGVTSTPIGTGGRVINLLTTGPFTAYYFFASDSAPFYCHVVVEPASGRYRHFGFGEMIKHGDWTGGEYVYGHYWDQNAAQLDDAKSASHQTMLDGWGTSTARCATIHAEGLADQGASEKWLAVNGSASGGTDRASVTRQIATGSTRNGMYGYYTLWMPTSQLNAYKAMVPVLMGQLEISGSPDKYMYLGAQADTAIINIRNLSPADEITIGADTWTVFPWVRKQFDEDGVNEESWNAGVAYKKIV